MREAAGKAGEQLKEATSKAGQRLAAAADERGLKTEGLKEVARDVGEAFSDALEKEDETRLRGLAPGHLPPSRPNRPRTSINAVPP